MNEQMKNIVLGALLHDLGKVVQRSRSNGNSKKHSLWGIDFLEEQKIQFNQEILDQIRYHHKDKLQNANIDEKSLAYITYCADNIAAASERRIRHQDEDCEEKGKWWFKRDTPIYSGFNVLYGSDEHFKYPGQELFKNYKIGYPLPKQEPYNYDYYKGALNKTKLALEKVSTDWSYFNFLLSTLENHWTFIPDCTCMQQLVDISLYDHSKMTAAFASCMYLWAEERKLSYKEVFYKKANDFYKTEAFCILTLDISGIQKFIYTIHSDGALKTLRARSFYLEILMEYITDELLDKIGLTRVNVLYIGGGSANILLPNNEHVKDKIINFIQDLNKWFMNEFKIDLYLGYAMQDCSANDLNGKNENMSYGFINNTIYKELDREKKHRYSAENIKYMNPRNYSEFGAESNSSGERECKVCHRVDNLVSKNEVFTKLESSVSGEEDYYCKVCMSMLLNSSYLLDHQTHTLIEEGRANKDIFYIVDQMKADEYWYLPLPNGKKLFFDTELRPDREYYHIYNKNKVVDGKDSGTHVWVADYKKGNTLEELAKKANGIERIGVIRADIDELGLAFADGFVGDNNTISRKANFSRMLSLFFKYHIKDILENGENYLGEKPSDMSRNATIVYSGGDDLFIVGSWDDIIGFAIDLKQKFQRFTCKKLTLSAGIGIYTAKYPIASIAREVGELEQCSKLNRGKDSITLFNEEFTFHWDCFINKVIGEKLKLIQDFFDKCTDYGNSFLHHLLELLKCAKEEPISLARYAFFIAKMEPAEEEVSIQRKKAYQDFKSKVYDWMKNARTFHGNNDEDNVKQLILAITIYLYLHREKENERSE